MNLFTKQITDRYLRENFEKIEQAFNSLVFTLGDFQFFEFRIEGAQEAFRLYHNLGFNPNDVIVTKAIGSSFEFDYNQFNDRYLTIKTTGDLYIRCFIGNMKGDEVGGSAAFAAILDDLGGIGGAGGGNATHYTREVEVDATLLNTRTIVLQGVPITGTEIVYYNGMPISSNFYELDKNIITIDQSFSIYLGDTFIIRFSS